MKRTMGNVDCSYRLDGDRLAMPTDQELRDVIKQCRTMCPEGAHLRSVDLDFTETSVKATGHYQGRVFTVQPRCGTDLVKPERYTLYDAAELAKIQHRRNFVNTWRRCERCGKIGDDSPTTCIDGEWICLACDQKRTQLLKPQFQ